MSNTTTTETFAPEETATAPSSPVSSPTAPSSASGGAPIAQSPTGGEDAPVASPVSVPTVSAPTSPVSPPVSAPIAGESFPASSPVSRPTFGGSFPSLSPEPVPSAPVFGEESPAFAPASVPSLITSRPFPTTYGGDMTAPTSTLEDVEKFMFNPFHFILIVAVTAIVTIFILLKCCKSWKLRREKQMLRLQSTRVDAVLGDMQMVGMDDYDGDDPELI